MKKIYTTFTYGMVRDIMCTYKLTFEFSTKKENYISKGPKKGILKPGTYTAKLKKVERHISKRFS